MSVVLSVLGWIVTIVLIVVLVLFLFVCFLLFSPLCYKAEGEYKEQLTVRGRVCWLFGLVWMSFSFQEGEFGSKIRLFGMDLQRVAAWRRKRKTKKTKKSKADKTKTLKHSRTKNKPEKAEAIEREEAENAADRQNIGKKNVTKATTSEDKENMSAEEDKANGQTKEGAKQEKTGILSRIRQWIMGWYRSIKAVFHMISSLRKKIGKKLDWAGEVRVFMKSANTRRMVCILKDNVIHLWRKLKPKVLRGSIIFGLGNPCSTGQALGIAAMFYAAYGQGIQITPDFEEARLEGNLLVKGRFSLITIVIILLRILLRGEWSRFRQEAEQLKEAF